MFQRATGEDAVPGEVNKLSAAPARSRAPRLRSGFVDLIDAAPLIVASHHGFFADEGLTADLDRQLGWGNLRDRLTFGQLDAAHALLGMPLFSAIVFYMRAVDAPPGQEFKRPKKRGALEVTSRGDLLGLIFMQIPMALCLGITCCVSR